MQLHNKTYRSAIAVLVGLIVLVVIGAIVLVRVPDFPFLSYLGGISTLAVALLTVAYVLTSAGQLSVMNEQLEQMRRSRDFQAQPLPVAMVTKVEIEKPRFFYAPPLNEYSMQSRIFVRFRIQNDGTHPAINVVSSGRLLLSDGKLLEAASVLAEVIPENSVHPSPTDSVGFMFVGDKKIEFIDTLRRRGMRGEYPVLAVRTIFRNALGSCFAAESYFQLSIPNVAAEAKLTDWHSLLVAFPVKYKAELERLRKLRQKNHDKDELDKLFNIVKNSFDEQIKDLSNLELAHFGIPLSFKVEPLDDEAYETEVKVKYFGSPAPYRVDECLHSEE